MHGSIPIVAPPSANERVVEVVTGHVVREGQIAHGPLVLVRVGVVELVEVKVQPLSVAWRDVEGQTSVSRARSIGLGGPCSRGAGGM